MWPHSNSTGLSWPMVGIVGHNLLLMECLTQCKLVMNILSNSIQQIGAESLSVIQLSQHQLFSGRVLNCLTSL